MGGALNGSVILRGIKIDLDTDIGNGFVIDCTRHVEELVSAEQLKAKLALRTWSSSPRLWAAASTSLV